MKKNYYNFYIPVILLLTTMCLGSCKKFVQIPDPPGQLVQTNVFSSDATATAAITGMYSRMLTSNGFVSGSILGTSVLCGLSADELINYTVDPWAIEFYTNSLSVNNADLQTNLWSEPYQYIYTVNASIEGLNSSTGVSAATKNQLIGEAKFIRAYCYFYLVNLFGEVPVIVQSDYTLNAGAKRDSVGAVYQQIKKDLLDAQTLLSPDYSFSSGERVRPNRDAATALLARVYLYTMDWTDAENSASTVINNTSTFGINPDLDSVFFANNMEAIWQLKPVQPGYNSNEANTFIIQGIPYIAAVSPSLLNAFETGDLRRSDWIDSTSTSGTTYYFPYKYKILRQDGSTSVVEYSTILRVAEQYLIRAEARAELNNISGAQADLNVIRNRAGLANTSASTREDILSAILKERQVELFTEFGQRWLDLKRTQKVDSVMKVNTPLKGGSWNSNQQLYPIPQPDRSTDPNLGQNPGY